jgi:orotidine-5'-phosphate decarboxylase
MSFQIVVSGHKDAGSGEASTQLEEEVAAETRKYVKSIAELVADGALEAKGTFGYIGVVDFAEEFKAAAASADAGGDAPST